MDTINILLAEDHTIVRKGLRSLLEDEENLRVAGEAADGRQAVNQVAKLRPDVVLMDIGMPGLNGIEATRQIKKRFPEVNVLILSVHSQEEYIYQTLRAGASGYLLKRTAPAEMFTAIRAVCQGQFFLSPSISQKVVNKYVDYANRRQLPDRYATLSGREREVLQLIAEGHPRRKIAEILHISVKTVETHRANLLKKLNIDNTAALIRFAIWKNLIAIDEMDQHPSR